MTTIKDEHGAIDEALAVYATADAAVERLPLKTRWIFWTLLEMKSRARRDVEEERDDDD